MAELDLMKDENTELTDQQMDELVSKSENKGESKEIPMTKEAQAPEPQPDLIEFNHNGKKIKGTRDQLIKWAQMGIDVPQKFNKFNQEKSQWDNQRKQWEQQYGPYKQIDEWAKQNPDKWTQLQQSWQQAQQAPQTQQTGQTTAEYLEIQRLKQELNELKPLVQTVHQDFTTSKQQAEDQALDQQIQSLRDKYKDLDWDTPDDNGKPLEYKVLEYAQETGIKNFDAAFKAFYHDELVSRAETMAKQNVSKDIQTKTKLGILGSSPTPKRGVQPVKDVNKKSYEDIMSEIREERAQGLYG